MSFPGLEKADIFVPSGCTIEEAFGKTTHIGVGAHPDDIEIMAFHGILECYESNDRGFTGVVCTDGASGPRNSKYAALPEEKYVLLRREEQKRAARIGKYAAVVQLGYPSEDLKSGARSKAREDLDVIFNAARPRTVYTHNLADKHDTHAAVALSVVAALRRLPPQARPKALYGCEVWRDLDWLDDDAKVPLDVSQRTDLAQELLQAFESQVAGGKRFDLGSIGRRRANATFFESHQTDAAEQLTFAMDLTALVRNTALDPVKFISDQIGEFGKDVEKRLRRISKRRRS